VLYQSNGDKSVERTSVGQCELVGVVVLCVRACVFAYGGAVAKNSTARPDFWVSWETARKAPGVQSGGVQSQIAHVQP
jgi:hypothetical protein